MASLGEQRLFPSVSWLTSSIFTASLFTQQTLSGSLPGTRLWASQGQGLHSSRNVVSPPHFPGRSLRPSGSGHLPTLAPLVKGQTTKPFPHDPCHLRPHPSWGVRTRKVRMQRVIETQGQEVKVRSGFLEEVAPELSLWGWEGEKHRKRGQAR